MKKFDCGSLLAACAFLPVKRTMLILRQTLQTNDRSFLLSAFSARVLAGDIVSCDWVFTVRQSSKRFGFHTPLVRRLTKDAVLLELVPRARVIHQPPLFCSCQRKQTPTTGSCLCFCPPVMITERLPHKAGQFLGAQEG